MPKRQIVGVVTSDKMNKSRRVEIERLVPHPKYGKFISPTKPTESWQISG